MHRGPPGPERRRKGFLSSFGGSTQKLLVLPRDLSTWDVHLGPERFLYAFYPVSHDTQDPGLPLSTRPPERQSEPVGAVDTKTGRATGVPEPRMTL